MSRYRGNRPFRPATSGLAGGIVILGLLLAFAFGGFNLSIFFVALAFASLVGSIGTFKAGAAYGGLQGFFWLLGLALCFRVGFWPWILLPIALSAIFGSLANPILAALAGSTFFGGTSQANQPPQQPYYQPQPQQSYEQGYRPSVPPAVETYQEGGQPHPYPAQPTDNYETPQTHYPQEMPPPQQQQ